MSKNLKKEKLLNNFKTSGNVIPSALYLIENNLHLSCFSNVYYTIVYMFVHQLSSPVDPKLILGRELRLKKDLS